MNKKPVLVFMIFSCLLAIAASWHLFKEDEEILSLETERLSFNLPDSLLDQSVFRRKKEIKKCSAPDTKGTVHFEMRVLPSGSNKVSLLHSDLNSQGLIECVFSALEKIKFPAFSGSEIIRFYTLQF